jgi:dihydrodipicolinate synthase/N-acetylneuraminate lyase
VHLRDWKLPGFTTGSGCIAPHLSQKIFAACNSADFDLGQRIREDFLPLEDLRDELGPARVLHAAVEAAGIARTGAIPPFVSELNDDQLKKLSSVANDLCSASC